MVAGAMVDDGFAGWVRYGEALARGLLWITAASLPLAAEVGRGIDNVAATAARSRGAPPAGPGSSPRRSRQRRREDAAHRDDFAALPGAPPIYTYEAKWVWDSAETPLDIYRCPAAVDPGLAAAIERTALAAYRVLRCRDWARIDLRCDEHGTPHVLEINPLPGIHPDPATNSCLPTAARAAGLDYAEMILGVLRAAAARHCLAL
jgi:hypothetical protein